MNTHFLKEQVIKHSDSEEDMQDQEAALIINACVNVPRLYGRATDGP